MTSTAVFDRLSALADPIRGRILLGLERQELTVREVQTVLQLPQSTVSRHLKVLADLGVVTTRAEGTSNWYRMASRDLEPAMRRLWQAVRDEVAGSVTADRDADRLQQVLAERHRTSQQFFTTSAGRWDKLRKELFGERAELMSLLGLLDSSWTVGDLGAGTGQTAAALAPFVQRVIAVDESGAMLKAARQRTRDLPNVELRSGTLEALPVANAELDVALLVLVLHHATDPARVLASAQRTLKPGGKLLLVDLLPHNRLEYREQMGHQWFGFSEAQLKTWLTDAGFKIMRFTPLPMDADAKGPNLFTATASTRQPTTSSPTRSHGT